MENKILKIVWLCYFSNQHVQDILKPSKRIGEIAPWITDFITLFENDATVELHIVSQHEWIDGYRTFIFKGITYHFYNAGIPIIGRHWPGIFRFDVWTNFRHIKTQIWKIVNRINPDIIHLHGIENTFCSAITEFYKKYPIFITIQGFVHKTHSKSKSITKRIENELKIIRMFTHFGYRTDTMGKTIMELNPNAILHWHDFPVKIPCTYNFRKKYDLVYFARVCKDKGIEDLLEAVSLIKKDKPDISLCVIGGGNIDTWEKKAKILNISQNIYWAGFLPTQIDVHKLASTAKISVLPTYHDIIPGTIVESMFLKIPVVAYNVGSIHEINKDEEIVSLVKLLDVEGLAQSILTLLNNVKLQIERAEKGYRRAFEIVTDAAIIKVDIINTYRKVINDF